jgi:signal peptidase I
MIPGWGQLYNGHPKKAVVLYGLMYLIPLIWGLTRLSTLFWGMMVLFGFEIALRIYVMIDAYKEAKKLHDYKPKSYNTWQVQFLLLTGYIAFVSMVEVKDIIRVESFKMPTPSSEPTIQVGDFVMSDLAAYNNREIAYGDIVSFEYEGGIWMYRVVALPNDAIAIENHIPIINGVACSVQHLENITVDRGIRMGGMVEIELLEEVLPNGHRHQIYRDKRGHINDDMESMTVPEGSYFMMGDNRSNATDSRFIGTITRAQIQGRIIYAYWGASMDRMNVNFRDK